MLSNDAARAFFMAGTVPVPSPFPAIGCLVFEPGVSRSKTAASKKTAGSKKASENSLPMDSVRIEYRQSPRLMISRTVLLQDIQAVFVPEDPARVDLNCGNWVFPPEIVKALSPARNGAKRAPLHGIVYVRESAPVLMNVQVGMTAAESAEYYPPILRERDDTHYDLGDAQPKCMQHNPDGPLCR